MVKLKTATKWLILNRFQHVIECLLHISGLRPTQTQPKKTAITLNPIRLKIHIAALWEISNKLVLKQLQYILDYLLPI